MSNQWERFQYRAIQRAAYEVQNAARFTRKIYNLQETDIITKKLQKTALLEVANELGFKITGLQEI